MPNLATANSSLGGSVVPLLRDSGPFVGRVTDRLLSSMAEETQPFGEDVSALISEVLGFAAAAEQKLTEQRARIAELEERAETDELTGVANRRGLTRFLSRTLATATRHGEQGVLIFLDLDGFKAVNDRFGHRVGDSVLVAVADFLSSELRTTDFVARLGGDEFVAVLTHCPPAKGLARSMRLQTRLNDLVLKQNGLNIPVSASVGVEPYLPGHTVERLLNAADQAMYTNKFLRARERGDKTTSHQP